MRCLPPSPFGITMMGADQLEYDQRLSDFLKEAETMLADMRDQIWTTIHALAESEGMTFEDCLSLMLHILLLCLQIPVDVLFQMQIPLTITYCPESSVYRKWHSKQGGVSPLCKEVRASQTLTKVLGRVNHQGSEGMDHPPSPATGNGLGSWTQILMLGGTRRLLKVLQAGS